MYNEIDDNMGYPIPLKIRRQWINTNSVTLAMKWISTAIMLIAAVAIVNDWKPYTIWLLNAGSVSWLITSILWREWSLIVVNAALLAVYGYGLIIA
jgi:hypothetical protein